MFIQEDQGRRFVRYWSDDTSEQLNAFVKENGLAVDWDKAFVSSTGWISMSGRRRSIKQWRLPGMSQA